MNRNTVDILNLSFSVVQPDGHQALYGTWWVSVSSLLSCFLGINYFCKPGTLSTEQVE